MNKSTWIQLRPYGRNLEIIYTDDIDAQLIKAGFAPKDFGAYMASMSDGNYQVVMAYNVSVPLMVHECSHVVLSLFSDIHSSIDEGDQEPFAYMIQYVVQHCLEFQKKVKGSFSGKRSKKKLSS